MTNDSTASGFRDADAVANPAVLMRHLDQVWLNPAFRARKERMFAALNLQPGGSVLDVGCGVGSDVLAMAPLVGVTGRAVGVDRSATFIAEARQRAQAAALTVDFEVGDVTALDFPDDTFDGVHAERVLLHVEDPGQALREMARVTRPGGRVVVSDQDYGLSAFDLPDRATQRKFHAWRADVAHRNGWIGRQLPRLFKAAGLTTIAVTPEPLLSFADVGANLVTNARAQVEEAREAGALTATEAEGFLAAWDAAIAAGDWFSLSITLVASGTKP